MLSKWIEVEFSSVQFDTLFNTSFSEVVRLLEEVGFQDTPKLPSEMEEERKWVWDERMEDRWFCNTE